MIDDTTRHLTGLLTAPEAAARLGVTRARVRQLVATGELQAQRVGDIWLVDEGSVERRIALQPKAGRRLGPASAWGLIFLADGLLPTWLDRHDRWRLRGYLPQLRTGEFAARMVNRGRPRRLRAHPGVLGRLREDSHLMLTGVSASAPLRLGLIGGEEEVEAYVSEVVLDDFMHRHYLRPSNEPNVTLRVVSEFGWQWPALRTAPRSAVGLDLLDSLEPRARQVGSELLLGALRTFGESGDR